MAHENISLIVATMQITLYGDFFPLIFKEMISHPILEGIKGEKNEYEGLRNEFVSH